jgi:hypothetical protein
MKTRIQVPARIHVILAREAETGVIIRRGPSKSVCTIGWDRQKDTFKLGQWLRGRIYERRCDLSPDGKYFIYFAMNGKWSTPIKGSWTAISRTPYLKAIGLWANGSCWNGGGLFMTNTSYWLNAFVYGNEEQQSPGSLKKHEKFPFHEGYGGECPGVYYIRLQRDGWTLRRHFNEDREHGCSVFEKVLPKGWILEKTAHATIHHALGKGCYYDTHRLVHPERDLIQNQTDWEWADWDRHRLVWMKGGILYAARMTSKGPGFARKLYDFNLMEFKAIAAPY